MRDVKEGSQNDTWNFSYGSCRLEQVGLSVLKTRHCSATTLRIAETGTRCPTLSLNHFRVCYGYLTVDAAVLVFACCLTWLGYLVGSS